MRYNVNKAWAVDDTTLYLEFDDGRRGTYDMSDLIGVGVFERLSDPAEFRAARSDGFTVVWPCGLDIAPEELARHLVVVPTRGYLFAGTLRENLLLGDPHASERRLWDVLAAARIDGFVREAGGLDMPIAEGAQNLSGGQRQRLCIARPAHPCGDPRVR